jgi:transcriptional regulator with XRE-family HTH domain
LIEIGGTLAAARRARGLELPEVEARTCIRAKQLAAIEAERWDELPGRAYARAFLRTYATALDLDADALVAEFDERYPEPEPEPPPRRRRPNRRYPVRLALTAAALLAVVAIVAWNTPTHREVDLPSVSPPRAAKTSAARHTHRAPRRTHAAAVDKRLVIRATRGNCWVLARRGGPDGPVLYEGTLTRGSVARFVAPRVWLRLGAPSVVDIHRGTHRLTGLPVVPTNVAI